MAEPKWKRFEQLVYEIQRALAPHARVTLDDRIVGAESKTPRQIDISIRERVGQYDILIVIECKDHAAPLDVQDVEAFVQKARDVRANKAALVSASGYTPASVALAMTHGVDTFRLVNAESSEWGSYVTVPALLCRTFLKSFSLTFRDFEQLPPAVLSCEPHALRELIVFNSAGRPLGRLRDLLLDKWRELDLRDKPGEHRGVHLGNLVIRYGDVSYPTEVLVDIIVAREYYFGPWPIEQLQALADTQRCQLLITGPIRTASLFPYEVETGQVKGWRKVENPELLAVRPVFTLYYSDAYEE